MDALEVFIDLYPAIVGSLHDIAYGWNRETISNVNGLLSAIEEFSFLLTLIVDFPSHTNLLKDKTYLKKLPMTASIIAHVATIC